MNLKCTIPTILLGLSPFFVSYEKKCPKIAEKVIPTIETDIRFKILTTDTFSRKISDESKIVNFNKLLKQYCKPVENYIVVDKNKCLAKVYNPNGDVLYETEVALGRNIGDKRAGGYMVKGAELRAYTTPGEFVICREGSKPGSKNVKLYGDRVMPIAGDHTQLEYKKTQTLALHRVPKSSMGRLRENVINNGTLKDNRVSFGCVNFLVESYDKMRKLISGKGTKVYILPEEKGNSLHLEKQKNGSYKFFQTKYRY